MRLLGFERTSPTSTVAPRRAARRRPSTTGSDRLLARRAAARLAHRWKAIAAGAVAVVALLGWLSTCFAQIDAGRGRRRAAVRRRDRRPRPGLHVRWPWPIETVTRIRPDEIRTVEVGFRTLADEQRSGELARTRRRRQHLGQRPRRRRLARLTDEAVMITGDGDLVEILATVRYHVADPRTVPLRRRATRTA